MAISFCGEIKEIRAFTSASGDKNATVKFVIAGTIDEANNVISCLNRLHRPESAVIVVVFDPVEDQELLQKGGYDDSDKLRKK